MSARVAVTAFFALDGFVVSSFFARLPALRDRLDLGSGEIGLALAALTGGLLVSQPLAGALAARRGSAPVVVAGGLAVSAAVVAPAFAPSLAALAVATAALGVANGALDVSMNVQGVAVERQAGRPILSGLHAAFSCGVLAGALAAGAAAAAGATPRAHLPLVAAIGLAVTAAAARGLLPAAADAAGGPAFARPSRALAGLAAIGFCALLAEGAVTDWSAIHLAGSLDASEAIAVAGLAAFSVAMILGRLAGDRITARLGDARHMQLGALLAGAGLLGAALAPSVPLAVAGFVVAGAGLSALFPLVVRAAAARPGTAAAPAIAAVSATGYSGLVAGPALIGFLAEATSLRLALATVLGGLCLVAAALAAAGR